MLAFLHFPRVSFKVILSGLIFVILLAGLAGGFYLIKNPTNFLPRADIKSEVPTTDMVLTTPHTTVPLGDVFPVDIVIRSDIDSANLFVAKLKYSDSLKVVRILTSKAQAEDSNDYFIQKWIKLDIKNTLGETDIVGGVISPGILTNLQDQKKMILARVFFEAEKPGTTTISQNVSGIYRNADNLNIFKQGKALTINVDNHDSTLKPNKEIPAEPSQENFTPLQFPKGGEIINYKDPIKITWEKEITEVTVSILINDKLLGNVITGMPKGASFIFYPTTKIPLAFLSKRNTFQFKVSGKTDDGQVITYLNSQPFEFSLSPQDSSIGSSSGALDLLKEFQSSPNIDLTTLSLLLTSFNSDQNLEKVDFNKDGYVNELDLWILKNLIKI
jgi:hypothetical protein